MPFAQMPARISDPASVGILAKVIYNCALNGICSLNEMTYGKILENDATRLQMERVIRECYAVGLKKAVKLDPPSADAFIQLMKEKLIPSTATHFPSMLQDLCRGKRTDIDVLNGAISCYGQEVGIPTPENDAITQTIHQKENQKVAHV